MKSFNGHLLATALNGFSLETADGRVVADERHGRKMHLIKYLICREGVPCALPSAAADLWPESTKSAAQSNMRVAIHQLKMLLTPFGATHLLKSMGGTVGMDTSIISVDCWDTARRATDLLKGRVSSPDDVASILTNLSAELLPDESCAEWSLDYRGRLASLKRSVIVWALKSWNEGRLSLQAQRAVDVATCRHVMNEPDDPEVVPAFVSALVRNNRCVEAIDVKRRFVREGGDPDLIPAIRVCDSIIAAQPDYSVTAMPRKSWDAVATCTTDMHSREVAYLGGLLDMALDGVGQSVILSGDDEATRDAVAEETLAEAEDRGALICDIPMNEQTFMHRCAFALARLLDALNLDASHDALLKEKQHVTELARRIERGELSFDEERALPFNISATLRRISAYARVVVSIDQGERLDQRGTSFVSQLFLLSRWSGLFVLLRLDVRHARGRPIATLLDAMFGTLPFVHVNYRPKGLPLAQRARLSLKAAPPDDVPGIAV